MERNLQVQATVVQIANFGELHRLVTLFSRELGLIKAVIFGGRKGKKTSLAPLFSFGNFQLYYNPVNEQYSLLEAECQFIAQNIKSDLGATYTASYMCEVLNCINTDQPEETYILLTQALKALEENISLHKKVLIDFTWQFIKLSGLGVDLSFCPSCDKAVAEKEIMYFSTSLTVPVCKGCSDTELIILMPGVRRYLIYTYNMNFSEAFEIKLLDGATEKLKTFLLKWISAYTRFPLKTIQSNML